MRHRALWTGSMAAGLTVVMLVIGGAPGAVAHTPGAAAPPNSIGPFAFDVAVDQTTSHAFVVSADMDNRNSGLTGQGRVSLLDTRTGALLRTVAAGRGSGRWWWMHVPAMPL